MSVLRLRLAAAAIIALIVTATVGLVVGPDSAEPTTKPTAVAAVPPPATHSAPAPTPTPSTPPRSSSPPAVSAGLAGLAANRIAIPRQHVLAAIDVCQIVDYELEPPADVRRTCFWLGGAPVAAAAGTTVITGHVNWVGQGTGALGRIDQLRPGDAVLTSGPRAEPQRWVVRSVTHRSKTLGIDTTAFVGRGGTRQLYLITCGGAFDPGASSYLDNIYVRAVPA